MTAVLLHRRNLWAALLCMAGAAVCVAAPAANLAARTALAHGRCAEAQHLLQSQLAANPRDADAQLLLCRLLYAEEQTENAVTQCRAAVAAVPPADLARQSVAVDWLGRALGQQASAANPLSAYKLAREVRATFERAVALDAADGPAASDLGDFYVQAPGVAGGSVEKAQALAESMLPRFPARAHRLLGLVAEKRNDLQGADREFHGEMAAGAQADGSIDFALFLARQHDRDRAVDAVRQAIAADAKHGPVEVDAASILISMKREPALAQRCLRDYLASPAQTDEAPVPAVDVMLGKLLKRNGDMAGARTAFQAALALAPDYKPAQKALDAL